jgi:hypothetical protein
MKAQSVLKPLLRRNRAGSCGHSSRMQKTVYIVISTQSGTGATRANILKRGGGLSSSQIPTTMLATGVKRSLHEFIEHAFPR